MPNREPRKMRKVSESSFDVDNLQKQKGLEESSSLIPVDNSANVSSSMIKRAKTNPSNLTGSDVLALQHTIGNQAVLRILHKKSSSSSSSLTLHRPNFSRLSPGSSSVQRVMVEVTTIVGTFYYHNEDRTTPYTKVGENEYKNDEGQVFSYNPTTDTLTPKQTSATQPQSALANTNTPTPNNLSPQMPQFASSVNIQGSNTQGSLPVGLNQPPANLQTRSSSSGQMSNDDFRKMLFSGGSRQASAGGGTGKPSYISSGRFHPYGNATQNSSLSGTIGQIRSDGQNAKTPDTLLDLIHYVALSGMHHDGKYGLRSLSSRLTQNLDHNPDPGHKNAEYETTILLGNLISTYKAKFKGEVPGNALYILDQCKQRNWNDPNHRNNDDNDKGGPKTFGGRSNGPRAKLNLFG